MAKADDLVLDVKNLKTVFFTNSGLFKAVDDVSFNVRRGETLAIVGESGCGKSVTALSVMRLVPNPPGRIVGGSIVLEGTDLLALDEDEMRAIRGNRMSMIFQEPMTSLNPVMRIGDQITEAVRLHQNMQQQEAVEARGRHAAPGPHPRARTAGAGISAPAFRRHAPARDDRDGAGLPAGAVDRGRADHGARRHHPGADPRADRRPAERLGTGLILITHDLGVVAQTAQRVIVMYAGKKVEEASVEALFENPRHPYTRGLMASMPAVISLGAKTDVAADRNSRHGAVTDQPAAGLRLRAALPAGDRPLPRGISAARGIWRQIIWRRAGARRKWRSAP